jgi:hypothetical protein
MRGRCRSQKQMPSQGFPREGLAAEGVGRKYDYVRSNECCRRIADSLTRGRAVAFQLLTEQRGLPDDVDGAGLGGRGSNLELRRSNASSTGLGSSDEANGGEQRNNDTHRHPPGATAPSGTRSAFLAAGTDGYLANALLVDESG